VPFVIASDEHRFGFMIHPQFFTGFYGKSVQHNLVIKKFEKKVRVMKKFSCHDTPFAVIQISANKFNFMEAKICVSIKLS
jgi:hypothetical protein